MAFEQQGTGFSNLQKIVDANSNNKLGSTIQGGIQNQADSTKSNLNSSYGQFQNDVNNNAVDTANNRQQVTDTVNKFGGGDNQTIDLGKGGFDESAAQPGQPTTPGPYGSPTDSSGGTVTGASPDISNQTPSLTGGDISSFEKFRSGTYNGPQQLSNLGDIQNQAQDTQQLGQSVNNSGGRQSLLQRFIGGNQYTQGQQNLDNLLLGATGAPNLQTAQQSTRGIVNQVNQAGSNAQALANQTASQNRAFADFTNQSIANVYDPQNAQLDANVASTQQTETDREAKIQALNNMLSKDNSADTAKSALQQLGDMGLISETNSSGGQSNINPTDGLLNSGDSGMLDPVTNQYVTQKSDGTWTFDGGPQNGQQYHPPGYNPGSDLDQWNSMVDNLSKYNSGSVPEQVNYNNILQQAIQDNQAQNVTRAGLVNSNEVARLNALNQLAGRQQEFADPTAIGNYAGGSQAFNSSQALSAIQAITDPAGAKAAADAAADAKQKGLDPLSFANNSIGDLKQGQAGLAAGDFVGNQFNSVGNLAGNNVVGNSLNSVGNNITSVGQGVQNSLNKITGGGGGGKIICNELHRQGYISDEIIKLDEAYGRKYRKYYREAYLGYLIVAGPIVTALQKYPVLAPVMMILTKPWSQYMANVMDSSIPGSKIGKVIHEVGIRALPLVYKAKRLCLAVKKFWITSHS